MTNDKELVDVSRKEFESTIGKIFPSLNFIWIEDEQKYMPFDTHLCWTAWIEAKRSQPIVVLPEPYEFDYYLEGTVIFDDVTEALTAAGIKYTIGE